MCIPMTCCLGYDFMRSYNSWTLYGTFLYSFYKMDTYV